MIERLAFAGIALLGLIVSLPRVPVFATEIVAQVPTPTPIPPLVIPAWILGGGTFYRGQQPTSPPTPAFYDVDPGATPDQHLFGGVLNAGVVDGGLGTNCPGIASGGSNVSNCNPYRYINMLNLLCDGNLESSNAYIAMNDGMHETAFLHYHATPTPSPDPRVTDGGGCPTPNISPTPGPLPSAGYYMNPDDTSSSGFLNWLQNHAWTTTNFPVPFGIYEDHFAVVGDAPCYLSYEYGNEACNMQGNSHSPAPNDWETALGDFESNAEANCPTTCFAFVGNGLTPGGGADTKPCGQFEGAHCYATPDAGVVDDMDALDNLCSAADSGGNLRAITAEEIVFLKGPPGAGSPTYALPQTIVYMINTMSHLVNYTTGACKNTVAIDIEAAGGSFYPLDTYSPGTVAGGIPVRLEATALRFLVPNPSTLVPDRMQPFYFTIGGTNNNWSPAGDSCPSTPYCEVPYMFEETLVPQGPEVPVAPFTWNGATETVGDGCPTPTPDPGDTGGAVDLMVTCVSSVSDPSTEGAAVFKQQYKHLYINGMDYGPAAVLLNTASATGASILSSWFSCSGCDPITTYHYKLALSGGELASVLYSGVTGGSISISDCTQPTYCTGDNSVSGNTAPFNSSAPGSITPHAGILLLKSN